MSNTQQRIISAIVMMALVVGCVVAGKIPTLMLILLIGLLCVDELLVNFSALNRKSFYYGYILFFFSLFFVVVNVFLKLGFHVAFSIWQLFF